MTEWLAGDVFEPPVVRCGECGQRCAVGVEAWFRTHTDRLVRYVRRTAARYGLSDATIDSEGVVQETFVHLQRSLWRVESPQRWLYRVARLNILSACHHPRSAPGLVDDYRDEDGRGISWTSLAQHAGRDDVLAAKAALRAIAELPDKQKVATYLACVEGWSHAEIADLLECSVSTVGVHVHRGKKAVSRGTVHIGISHEMAARVIESRPSRDFGGSDVAYGDGPPWVWMWCSCRRRDRPDQRSLFFCPDRMVWVSIEPD